MDTLYWGFPFPYKSEGWHTSGAMQVFVLELLTDLGIYVLFWLMLIVIIRSIVIQVKESAIISKALSALSILVIVTYLLFLNITGSVVKWHRNYEKEVLETGFSLLWQETIRPDYYLYHPKDK